MIQHRMWAMRGGVVFIVICLCCHLKIENSYSLCMVYISLPRIEGLGLRLGTRQLISLN